MAELAAIRNALYLFHMPSQVRQARSGPLPGGVSLLLEVAAGEASVTDEAAEALKRPADVLRDAAAFYIEQVLLAPEADSYRVLGATRETSSTDLRRNMALLLRWTHPDADRPGTRTAFANRVTKAWENLKTHDRRESYDASHPVRSQQPSRDAKRPPHGHASTPIHKAGPPAPRLAPAAERPGLFRRTLSFLLSGRR